MDKHIDSLKKCVLMRNFSESHIKTLLKEINYSINSYCHGEVIALENSNCNKIGIILHGNVQVQKIYISGKIMTISKLNRGNIFGEVIIFSDKSTYPATIMSSSNSTIMFISNKNILKLCSINTDFLNNFMTLLSNKILMLNKKVKNMSYETLRQKICSYIIEEYEIQKSKQLKLDITRKEMAEQLGIPRPSLSRELINMKNDNLIDVDKNIITIKNMESICNLIY